MASHFRHSFPHDARRTTLGPMVRCPNCAYSCPNAFNYCVSCGAELGPQSAALVGDALLGTTLPGGYRITQLVGVGGMGRVYRAEQVALDRTVAVKVVHPQLAGDELAAARFLNEARAASRLSHPNSVAIFDFGRTADGYAYIVMEYLRGQDLGRVAVTEGPLALRRVVHILQQTLAALGEAHALGIVHRDVKPDNIVIEPLRSGLDFVKVVDFGLAKLLSDDFPALGPSQSRPGLVCGTPEYMSPEQSRGDLLDGRSDLYSVGIVLFELLTGQLPFVGDTQDKTLLLQLTEPPPDPRDFVSQHQIPPAFADLALRALAKSRDDRPQTAAAFADMLEQALTESEGRGVDPGPVTAIRCSVCGRLTPLGQRFCGECGSVISRSPAPPPVSGPQRPGYVAGIPLSLLPSPRVEGVSSRDSWFTSLVGRDDAVQWLEARHREAASMPSAAHLVGEPGMGKTRLLHEALERWSALGDRVFKVGPDPAWGKVGDAAVRAAIQSLALPSGEIDSPTWESANRDARKGLRALFGANPASLAPHDRRAAIAEALRWSLQIAEGRVGAGRVILAIDDLDFVDGTSRNAFADVLSEPAPARVLIVATYSPGTRPVSDPVAGEIWRLDPLPYESFVRSMPARLMTPQVALAPLHIEQLLAWAEETAEAPPEQLGALMARRTERLAVHARHTLHALAVWGDSATLDLLARMLPPAVDVGSGAGALERARIISIDTTRIRICHPLMRRVALASIPAGRKRELFARCVELRPDAPLEVRADDVMHGGSAFEALVLLDQLAARRSSHGDVLGSVSSLRHALDLARRELHRGEIDDPSTAVLVFSRKLAEALVVSHRWSDADGILREALGNAPPNSEHRAHLLGVMAHVANARRHPGEARRYLEEAIRVARQSDARGLMPLLEHLDKTIAVA
jgi:serine/threonine protein kinase